VDWSLYIMVFMAELDIDYSSVAWPA